MEKKLFMVVNPCSGTVRMKTEMFGVVKIFSDSGYTVTVYVTKKKGDATQKVKNLSGEYSLVVCCGGDGTLNEVITGLMANKNSYKLGYIPAGTLNEWSSGLGISKNILCAAKDITKENSVKLDIGLFGDRYFSYTASFGAFTEASYTAPQNVKNVLGQAAYIIEGIKGIGNIKPLKMKFEIDGEKTEGEFLFGAVSNSMSVGGVVKFDETVVNLSDGLFEILLIRNPQNIIELNDIVDGILKKDMKRKNIEFYHAKKVKVLDCKGIPWTLDGEFFKGAKEIVIENLHSAIDFTIPEKKGKRS